MALPADAGLVYACFTHVPLTLALPPYVVPIYLGAAQHDGALNLRDLAPEWEPHHPTIGSTAGAFALRNLVRERFPQATRIGICHYRKFISRERISGIRDPRYRVMDVIPKAALAPAARFGDLLWPGDAEFLVSAPRRFTRVPWHRRGYLKEYQRDHCVEDLLRFAAEAVDQGLLERKEVLAFFREDVILPGGFELGVYPAPFWLQGIDAIERVVRGCVTKHATARAGYQARLWAFCVERLGSFMLLKRFRAEVAALPGSGIEWLDRHRWRARFAGQMNLVVDDASHAGYVGGT
jgi:hypothetical protein